jgi:hypothetical protein
VKIRVLQSLGLEVEARMAAVAGVEPGNGRGKPERRARPTVGLQQLLYLFHLLLCGYI